MWFAFNFSSFYLWYQQLVIFCSTSCRCDLLSISVLSIFDTNTVVRRNIIALVVICFQFQFFLSLIPTFPKFANAAILLWFAFNFSSFYLWYQPNSNNLKLHFCCDLLSISVLSIFDTNHQHLHLAVLAVVICFQFQFFLSLIPTSANFEKNSILLWFAFNFSSFYLWYQLEPGEQYSAYSCDLLSISVLSIFDTNLIFWQYSSGLVVICFQFQFFLSLIPTLSTCSPRHCCCDLLSISVLSIFDTNRSCSTKHFQSVVICFQFQFFLSLIPTFCILRLILVVLWFAFNFSSFYLWYQRNCV